MNVCVCVFVADIHICVIRDDTSTPHRHITAEWLSGGYMSTSPSTHNRRVVEIVVEMLAQVRLPVRVCSFLFVCVCVCVTHLVARIAPAVNDMNLSPILSHNGCVRVCVCLCACVVCVYVCVCVCVYKKLVQIEISVDHQVMCVCMCLNTCVCVCVFEYPVCVCVCSNNRCVSVCVRVSSFCMLKLFMLHRELFRSFLWI